MTYTLIHCLILTLVTGKVLSSCRVRDFKVQENFDIKKVISFPGVGGGGGEGYSQSFLLHKHPAFARRSLGSQGRNDSSY